MLKVFNHNVDNYSGSHWDIIVSYMNDDIRESLHHKFAPCSRSLFLTLYCAADPDFYDFYLDFLVFDTDWDYV